MYKYFFLLVVLSTLLQAQSSPDSSQPLDSTNLEIAHAEKAVYPMMAAQKGIQGRVVVKLFVTEAGGVDKVELISGDPMLKDAALHAAKKFRFKPFIRNGKPIRVTTNIPFDFAYTENVQNTPPPIPAPSAGPAKRVQLSHAVTEGLILRKVRPVYPREALLNRVEGSVVLEAVIGRDGSLINIKPVKGPPELIPAAIGAVQQWRYRPYELGGEPVEVDTLITINFSLQ